MKKNLPLILLLVIGILFVFHAIYLNCVAEDAFISFRFAKNLVEGNGLRWNGDEAPVEGYTNFSWVLLSALALKLGLFLPRFSQIAGVAASLVTIIFVYKFCRRYLNMNKEYSLIPCLFLSFSGPFATWAASGMETNLFGLFLILGVYYFIGYLKLDRQLGLYFCYFFLLLSTLTRPEGFGVFVLIVVINFLAVWKSKRSFLDFLKALLLYIVPFSAYFGWRIFYFGFPFPNTFYAKTGGTLYQYLRGLKYTGTFFLFFLLPFAFLLAFYFWEKKRGLLPRENRPDLSYFFKKNAGTMICGMVCLLYIIIVIYEGGDYMAMYRFYVPILAFIYILFGVSVHSLFSMVSSSRPKIYAAVICVLFALAATFIQSTPLEARLFKEFPFMHGTYRGVQTERWHTARLSLIGKFFYRYKKSSDESLGTRTIGAISFFARMKIYGLDGLVDPEIAHQKNKNLGKGFPGHEKSNEYLVILKKPTYFMFDRRLYKRSRRPPNYGPEVNQLIRDNYKLTYYWLIDKANDEEGYFTFLELIKK